MAEFRSHALGSGVTVEQYGADGIPTHWRVKRYGSRVGAADDETDALILGYALALAASDHAAWIGLIGKALSHTIARKEAA